MFPTNPNVMSESVFHSFIYQKRSYSTEVFYKKYVLKNFPKFTGKHLCPRLVFDKVAGLSPATWLKKDSSTGVFLWILWNFQEQLFLQNNSGGCFWFIWIVFIRLLLLNMTRKFTNLLHSEWTIINPGTELDWQVFDTFHDGKSVHSQEHKIWRWLNFNYTIRTRSGSSVPPDTLLIDRKWASWFNTNTKSQM